MWRRPSRRLPRALLTGPVGCLIVEPQNFVRADRGTDGRQVLGVDPSRGPSRLLGQGSPAPDVVGQ